MTPQEIVAEFNKEEISRIYNKTAVKDAFIVGYAMMRSCALPKLGEQLDAERHSIDGYRILTFKLEHLPELTYLHIKELSNLGFWLDTTTNRIYYKV